MAKLWTSNKSYQSNTTPNSNTKYLVGVSNGKCNYQTISSGQTKRCLISNGNNGNIAYTNISASYTALQNLQNAYNRLRSYYFGSITSGMYAFSVVDANEYNSGKFAGYNTSDEYFGIDAIILDTANLRLRLRSFYYNFSDSVGAGFIRSGSSGSINDAYDWTRGLYRLWARNDSRTEVEILFDSQRKVLKGTNGNYVTYTRHGTFSGYDRNTTWDYVNFYYKDE